MEVIEYIKKTHKKYIGDNPKADYYNNKYIYEFKYLSLEHYGEDIDYFYKNNIYNKYDNIIINTDVFDCYKHINYYFHKSMIFLNNEIYVDNEFLIYFINNYKKYQREDSIFVIVCSKIIINYDYELIQQQLINKKIYFKIYFICNTLIFENGFFNSCFCHNFICNSKKIIKEYFNFINCNNFIINDYTININKIYIKNSIINNSNNNNNSIINILYSPCNNILDLTKNYIIKKLYLLDYKELIKSNNIKVIFYINNNITDKIVLYDNIDILEINYSFNIGYKTEIIFNNYIINEFIIKIGHFDDNDERYIYDLINSLSINNSINNLTVILTNLDYDIYYKVNDFKHIKINKFKIPN